MGFMGVSWAAAGFAVVLARSKYNAMSDNQKAYWRVNFVHLLFSSTVGLGSLWLAISNPSGALGLSSLVKLPDGGSHGPEFRMLDLATILICLATGFYGFMLYTMVHDRLLFDRYKTLVHYTILLLLFGCAVYKRVQMTFLSTTLMGELSNVWIVLGRLQTTTSGSPSDFTQLMKKVTVPVFTLLPNCFRTFVVATSPAAFAPTHWLMALMGLLYMNWSSLLLTQKTMRTVAKERTA